MIQWFSFRDPGMIQFSNDSVFVSLAMIQFQIFQMIQFSWVWRKHKMIQFSNDSVFVSLAKTQMIQWFSFRELGGFYMNQFSHIVSQHVIWRHWIGVFQLHWIRYRDWLESLLCSFSSALSLSLFSPAKLGIATSRIEKRFHVPSSWSWHPYMVWSVENQTETVRR